MLECRLEILFLIPIKPAHLNMQPQRGQYNNVLANDTYLVTIVKELYYMTFDWWISKVNLHKANFILYFFTKPFLTILIYKGQNNPQILEHRNHHPSECMALSSCLIVSSQVLKHSETVMRFFRTFHDLRLKCP
jgi:hypothetical protein